MVATGDVSVGHFYMSFGSIFVGRGQWLALWVGVPRDTVVVVTWDGTDALLGKFRVGNSVELLLGGLLGPGGYITGGDVRPTVSAGGPGARVFGVRFLWFLGLSIVLGVLGPGDGAGLSVVGFTNVAVGVVNNVGAVARVKGVVLCGFSFFVWSVLLVLSVPWIIGWNLLWFRSYLLAQFFIPR